METNHPRISRTPGVRGGKACVAGHRMHEHQGLSADAIVSEYPGLSLVDVYSALAYYFEHLEEIRAEIRADRDAADRFRADNVRSAHNSNEAALLSAVRD